MCELFDASWKLVLGFLLLLSIFTLLLRVRYSSTITRAAAFRGEKLVAPPQWVAALFFWGAGLVGASMVLLMVLGVVCVGSPGDIEGIVPN